MPIPKMTSAGASSVPKVNAAEAAKELDELTKMAMEKQKGDEGATGAVSGKQGKAAKGDKPQEGKLIFRAEVTEGLLFQSVIKEGLIFEFHDKKGDVYGDVRARVDEDPDDLQKMSVEEMMEKLKRHENEQLRLLAGRLFPRGLEGPVWGEREEE